MGAEWGRRLGEGWWPKKARIRTLLGAAAHSFQPARLTQSGPGAFHFAARRICMERPNFSSMTLCTWPWMLIAASSNDNKMRNAPLEHAPPHPSSVTKHNSTVARSTSSMLQLWQIFFSTNKSVTTPTDLKLPTAFLRVARQPNLGQALILVCTPLLRPQGR